MSKPRPVGEYGGVEQDFETETRLGCWCRNTEVKWLDAEGVEHKYEPSCRWSNWGHNDNGVRPAKGQLPDDTAVAIRVAVESTDSHGDPHPTQVFKYLDGDYEEGRRWLEATSQTGA